MNLLDTQQHHPCLILLVWHFVYGFWERTAWNWTNTGGCFVALMLAVIWCRIVSASTFNSSFWRSWVVNFCLLQPFNDLKNIYLASIYIKPVFICHNYTITSSPQSYIRATHAVHHIHFLFISSSSFAVLALSACSSACISTHISACISARTFTCNSTCSLGISSAWRVGWNLYHFHHHGLKWHSLGSHPIQSLKQRRGVASPHAARRRVSCTRVQR